MTDHSTDQIGADQLPGRLESAASSLATLEAARIRDELVQLADAAVLSAEHELAATVAIVLDLLGIVNCLERDSGVDPSANEMLQFCVQQALPTIRSAADHKDLNDHHASETALRALGEEVQERWGAYLELLTPEERFSHGSQSDADSMDSAEIWNDWNRTAGDDAVAQSTNDELSDQHSLDFNLGLILASLNEISSDEAAEAEASEAKPAESTATSASGQRTAPSAGHLPVPPKTIEVITDPDLVSAYADDAQQCLAEMEASLLNLESGHGAEEARLQFCRQLHTLKGASGTVGLLLLAGYLHKLESYVESFSGSGSELDIEALLQCVDVVREQIQAISPGSDAAVSGRSTLSATESVSRGAQHSTENSTAVPAATNTKAAVPAAGVGSAAEGEQFVRVEASRLDRLMDLLAELVMLRNRRDTYVKSLRALHHELNDFSTRTRTLNAAFESGNSELASRESDFFGHADDPAESELPSTTAHARLLSRSLLELSNDVSEIGRSLHEICEPLSEDNSVVSHLIGRFRQELMELQRMPIGGLFQRLHRSVRDAARAENKLVELVVLGQGARVERSVQERLFEPLMHIVRNAVSHGIEPAEARTAAGKSTVGRISLNAWSSVSSLFIEISDDGRGLNDELLESKGRKLGLLPAGQAVSRERLWKLIFHPGFSTRTQVTEISGRGVGMDIVDNWVRRLRGRIDVESVPGQGTTFRLQIPIRSAIEHAMIVQVGGQLFALPMQAVSGTADATPRRGATTEAGQSKSVDSALSPAASRILHLNQLLGIESSHAARPCYLSLNDLAAQKRQSGSAAFDGGITIAVDAVVGVEEVVVRALPPLLQRHELFSGVTLSGRADTVLLLDVPRLIEFSRKAGKSQSIIADKQNSESRNRSSAAVQSRILVADDSVTVRRTLSKKLRVQGFTTVEVSNGAEALKVLRSGGISAVVTDIDMPRMNGLELLQEIRSHRQFRSLPVVVVTSRDDRRMLSRLMDCGATDVLCKPVTDATVSAIVSVVPANVPVVS